MHTHGASLHSANLNTLLSPLFGYRSAFYFLPYSVGKGSPLTRWRAQNTAIALFDFITIVCNVSFPALQKLFVRSPHCELQLATHNNTKVNGKAMVATNLKPPRTVLWAKSGLKSQDALAVQFTGTLLQFVVSTSTGKGMKQFLNVLLVNSKCFAVYLHPIATYAVNSCFTVNSLLADLMDDLQEKIWYVVMC